LNYHSSVEATTCAEVQGSVFRNLFRILTHLRPLIHIGTAM